MRHIAIACLIAVAACKTNDDGAALKDIEGATTPGSWTPGTPTGGEELAGTGWRATYTVGGFAGAQAALHRIDADGALVRQNYAYVNPCNGGATVTCTANGWVLKLDRQALKATLQNFTKDIHVAMTCKVANGPGGQGLKCDGQDDAAIEVTDEEEPAPVDMVALPGKAWKIVFTTGGFAGPQAAAHRVKGNGAMAAENYAFLSGCSGGQTVTCKSSDGNIQFKMSKSTKKGQVTVGEELATPLTCTAGSAPQGEKFICTEG